MVDSPWSDEKDDVLHRKAVSSEEASLCGSGDDERGALSDSEIQRLNQAKELARQVKGPSSDALEIECEKQRLAAAADADSKNQSDNTCCSEPDAGPELDADGFEDVLGGGDLWIKTLSPGIGSKPEAGQLVTISVESTTNPEDVIKELTFPLGYHYVIDAWEIVVQMMQKGQVTAIKTSGRFAYGDIGWGVNVPPGAPQEYEIILLEIADIGDWETMPAADVRGVLEDLKERAKFFYAKRHYDRAININQKGIELITKELKSRKDEFKDLHVNFLVNLSFAYFQQKQAPEGLETTAKGLEIDPENVKLLLKRGQFHVLKKEYKQAIGFFRRLVDEFGMKTVVPELATVEAQLQAQVEQEKQVYKRMFGALGKAPIKKAPAQPSTASRFAGLPTLKKVLILSVAVVFFAIAIHYFRHALGISYW